VPVDRLEEGVRAWNLHDIVGWAVEGLTAADPEVRAGSADEGFDVGKNESLGDRFWRGVHACGEAVALVDVEDCEALEEEDLVGLLARLLGAPAPLLRRETVGVDDGHTVFAPADRAL
jgi:hypothetical protein